VRKQISDGSIILPERGGQNPLNNFKSVDLPHPDDPETNV